MPSPIVILVGKELGAYLNALQDSISFLAKKDGKSEEEVDTLLNIYKEVIEPKREIILESAATLMRQYCGFYKVNPTEGIYDEFKGVYFSAMAVLPLVENTGIIDLKKYLLKGMLGELHYRLAVPYDADRDSLKIRLAKVVNENKLDEDFGKYGIYILFKCLYNHAKESHIKRESLVH